MWKTWTWFLPLFQERIFLTVSNYIFTAIFVGEMTLKVVLGFTGIFPTPPEASGLGLTFIAGLVLRNIP